MWDKRECPLSQAYMDDMAAIGSVVDLGAAIEVPWLLVHGEADTVVPISDSRDIRAAAGSRPELIEIKGVDHVFSGAGEAVNRLPLLAAIRLRNQEKPGAIG